MIINQANLGVVFTGFNALFNKGMETAPSAYKQIAMTVPSTTREEIYAWLGQVPGMREWIGARVVRNLATHGFKIANKDFESTVGVPRNDIEDDRFGVFGPCCRSLAVRPASIPTSSSSRCSPPASRATATTASSSSTPIIRWATARAARS